MVKQRENSDGSVCDVNLGGWRLQDFDERDDKFRFCVPVGSVALPRTVDLRKICSPVEDQGSLGSCTANMFAGMVEANAIKSGRVMAVGPAVATAGAVFRVLWDRVRSWLGFGRKSESLVDDVNVVTSKLGSKVVHVSRLFHYYATRILEGTTAFDSGATIRNAIKAGVLYGVTDEVAYPYVISKFTTKPPATIWDAAAKNKVTSYHAIKSGDIASMKTALVGGSLVGFGFRVYDAFLSGAVARSGMLCRPKSTEKLHGGHAVALVGYDDSKVMPDGSKGAFLVRNSWGASWGLGGYFWMSYNYVSDKNLCFDFWVVVSTPI